MKKYILPLLLLISACNKHDQDCYPQRCQITKLINTDQLYGDFTATFTYDATGSPLRVTRDRTNTGSGSYAFRHDSRNRVTDAISAYGPGNPGDAFDIWHRLKYDNRNRVIQDSIFSFGIIGPNPIDFEEHPALIQNFIFTYDAKNRIVKSESIEPGYPSTERFYYYNSNDNLDSMVLKLNYSGESYTTVYTHYDNKINFRRTNALWQFLDKNYSANNELNTVTFNRYGLPTSIAGSTKFEMKGSFLGYPLGDVNLEYSCK
jgi:hypothetical protein